MSHRPCQTQHTTSVSRAVAKQKGRFSIHPAISALQRRQAVSAGEGRGPGAKSISLITPSVVAAAPSVLGITLEHFKEEGNVARWVRKEFTCVVRATKMSKDLGKE